MDRLLVVLVAVLAFVAFILLVSRAVKWILLVGTALAAFFLLVYLGVLG